MNAATPRAVVVGVGLGLGSALARRFAAGGFAVTGLSRNPTGDLAGLALDPTGWLAAASLAVGKSGLRSLAQTLHKELAPAGIHVGTVTRAHIPPGC